MGLFGALFGRPDPTKDWPEAVGPAPELDAGKGALGPLKFDAPLEEARFLGRPDEAKWRDGVLELVWARRGLVLEFVDGKFIYAAWIVGPDAFAPKHPSLRFARPHPVGGPALDGRTTEQDLFAWLGSPDLRDADADEIVVEWTRGEITVECELTPAGHLKRLNAWTV